jgi:hypothetical protein
LFLASIPVIDNNKFCDPSLSFSPFLGGLCWLVACARSWNAVRVHRYRRTRQERCPSVPWKEGKKNMQPDASHSEYSHIVKNAES